MPNKLSSNLNGESNPATIARRPVTPSTNAVLTPSPKNRPISDTSATTAPTNQTVDFQLTPNLQTLAPNAQKAKLLNALAVALGALVSWHKIELGEGRVGWALYFDETKWMVDPLTHELTPLGKK